MTQRRALVTGNLGYIGPILVGRLRSLGWYVTGLDAGFYAETSGGVMELGAQKFQAPLGLPDRQIVKDIRDLEQCDVTGSDVIFHLAGLSNDPLGELDPNVTKQINREGTIRLANLAIASGCTRFVFSSSQSMYGVLDSTQVATEDDASIINPLTTYAKTKWEAEQALCEMACERFCPVVLRPATVFGGAPNLRTDIVFNNLLCAAYTTGKVFVKSDGSPWRPVVHLWDLCTAFILAAEAPADEVYCQAYNVGYPGKNYQVCELANMAHCLLPNSEIVYAEDAAGDERTYRVSFDKLANSFDCAFSPVFNLESGGAQLLLYLQQIDFQERHFRGVPFNRLKSLQEHMSRGLLDTSLRRVRG